MYNTGIATFFTIAVILVIILVNIGFSVSDTQKLVVDDALDEVDEHFVIAGKITAMADISLDTIIATASPVRTSSDGSISVDSQIMDVSYKLVQKENYIINYENIYVGSLPDKSYNSIKDAVKGAKNYGIIEVNPFVDGQETPNTSAFIYWIINQNYDYYVDNDELAALAIVYADKDRPSSGEQLIIQANVPDGYVLKIEQQVPNISSRVLNFGGVISGS